MPAGQRDRRGRIGSRKQVSTKQENGNASKHDGWIDQASGQGLMVEGCREPDRGTGREDREWMSV